MMLENMPREALEPTWNRGVTPSRSNRLATPWRSTQHRDLEHVRALLGHPRIETTQVYAQIQPAQLKESVKFYEARALEALTT